MSTLSVTTARCIPADLGAVGITFRDRGDRAAQWLASDGTITSRVVHATAWWPRRGHRPGLVKPAFIAAQIARNFPGAVVTVRPLGGSKPLLTFIAS